MRKKVKVLRISDIFIYSAILFFAVITLYPFVHVTAISFSGYVSLMESNIFIFPRDFTLTAYKSVLSNKYIFSSLLNSTIYTVTGTLLSVFFTMTMAYPLAKRHFTGRRLFSFLITFTLLFSAGIIPVYLVVNKLGLMNTIWAIVLPFLISPWNLIITRTFLEELPVSIQESAIIDGCNDIKTFFYIIVPLSFPIMATIGIFYAVYHWNSYFWPVIFLNTREQYPVQIILREIVIQGTVADALNNSEEEVLLSESIKGATIMVATLPILVVYPFLQKYFVKGMLIGSIKG